MNGCAAVMASPARALQWRVTAHSASHSRGRCTSNPDPYLSSITRLCNLPNPRWRCHPSSPLPIAAAPTCGARFIAFALRFQGRKRVHNADEIMAEIVARRLVEHLERAGFVVMKRPPEIGAAALGKGYEW